MSDTEKQEGQKTVVAFIAGLLIGGLLVWVFSSSPESAPRETSTDTAGETASESVNSTPRNTTTNTNTQPSASQSGSANATPAPVDIIRNGNIGVSDQPAGSVVVLDSTTFPTVAGWVVVRDYMDGVPGNILGAARYNETEGLIPSSVNLLRGTEIGSTYQLMFYSENGDRVFDLSDDTPIDDVAATFVAQ